MKYLVLLLLAWCNAGYSMGIPDTARLSAKSVELREIDSLIRLLARADGKLRFDIQFELFGRYQTVNPQKGQFYLDKCIEQAARSQDSLWIVKVMHAKGHVEERQGNLEDALQVCEQALGIAKRNKYDDRIIYLLNSLANISASLAKFDKALQYHFESLHIRENRGNAVDVSTALNNIGITYFELGDFENALSFLEKSYELKVKNGIEYDIEKSQLNICSALIGLGKFSESESRIKRVLSACSGCGIDIVALGNYFLGVSLLNQFREIEAESHLAESISIFKLLGTKESLSRNYYWLAKLRYNQGKLDEAINYLDSSQFIAVKSGFQKTMQQNYRTYADISYLQKKHYKAILWERKYSNLSTEIMNGDLLRRISAIQISYQEKENRAKIESQQAMMHMQSAAIRQHQLLNLTIGIGAILMSGLVFVLYRINRQKQEINNLLDLRVKERTRELEQNRDVLLHAYDQQEIVLRRVSSKLTSSLATFQGLAKSARHELTTEQATYFREVEVTAKDLVNYVSQHQSIKF